MRIEGDIFGRGWEILGLGKGVGRGLWVKIIKVYWICIRNCYNENYFILVENGG